MESDLSIANLILGASALVKFVMLLLLSGSVSSWALIFAKRRQVQLAKREIQEFEDEFWSTEDLTRLFNRVAAQAEDATGMERIFESGFREFARLRKRGGLEATDILDGAQRAMKVTVNREMEALEANLPTLATIGSISPYVGLFGTVWGIMNSFQALGNVHQATLAMVAPGISEALVATAMGLFAAIPAVVAYNRFASDIDRVFGRYDIFAEEFLAILRRQAHD
ncbi:MAG: protein TolQ [Gammaproteobacteria bacterium]|nr:protein TolQ [Gammaproteobacteria bacterium]